MEREIETPNEPTAEDVANVLRDVREFMDDPVALLERAIYLLGRTPDGRDA